MSYLDQSLTLPCGVDLSNRLAKAAMSENMAKHHQPAAEFFNAYKMWANGGTGLLISGNVMIDSRHLGEPNNIVIEKGFDNREALRKWAKSVEGTTSQLWLQINHPGKQSPKFLNKQPLAPSAIPLSKKLKSMFNNPRELTTKEIEDIIERFAYAAKIAKECGFHGVQIHGAHGYLVSQFLSPIHNIRQDQYGGSLEKRMFFLKEVYRRMREEVGDNYPIGLKINSSDFSKGGFSHEDAVATAESLSRLGIDLIEVSGGSYESPAMIGQVKESTRKREAYFLDYTKEIKKHVKCPLMVTGGFRTQEFMNEVLKNGEVDLVGLARPLALNPNLSNEFLQGKSESSDTKPISSGMSKIDNLFPLEIIWYTKQIHRMGRNKLPDPSAGAFSAIFHAVTDLLTH